MVRRQECLHHQKFRESPATKPRAAGFLRRYLLKGGGVGGGAADAGGEELEYSSTEKLLFTQKAKELCLRVRLVYA